MEKPFLVSVIIPNYNGRAYLDKCMESLSQQSYSSYEIILVDNGSTDGSCGFIRESYPEVKLLCFESNLGFSKAVNEGILVSKGKYVALLNNDTEVERDWLLRLVECIDKDEKVFSCSSKMLRFDRRDKIDNAGVGYNILGWAYKRYEGLNANHFKQDCIIFSSCGGAAIYRREVFDVIGYFDEDFFAYMEDVEICCRANMAGYKNLYCAGALVYHIGSATTGSRHNAFKVRLAARNNIYLCFKNYLFFQLIIHFPFIILGNLIKYVFFAVKGLGREYREGILEGLKSIGKHKKTEKLRPSCKRILSVEFRILADTCLFIYLTFIKLIMRIKQ